jgi:hypothetical protein
MAWSSYHQNLQRQVGDHSHHLAMVKLQLHLNDDKFDELLAHSHVMRCVDKNASDKGTWKLKEIKDHRGPIRDMHKINMGSSCNMLINGSMVRRFGSP